MPSLLEVGQHILRWPRRLPIRRHRPDRLPPGSMLKRSADQHLSLSTSASAFAFLAFASRIGSLAFAFPFTFAFASGGLKLGGWEVEGASSD